MSRKHPNILTLYLPDVNAALIDVVLLVLLEVLTKKVNENNNQILHEYFGLENTIIYAFAMGSENVGEYRMSSEDTIRPRSLGVCKEASFSNFHRKV